MLRDGGADGVAHGSVHRDGDYRCPGSFGHHRGWRCAHSRIRSVAPAVTPHLDTNERFTSTAGSRYAAARRVRSSRPRGEDHPAEATGASIGMARSLGACSTTLFRAKMAYTVDRRSRGCHYGIPCWRPSRNDNLRTPVQRWLLTRLCRCLIGRCLRLASEGCRWLNGPG
jgi:hypothetical protein